MTPLITIEIQQLSYEKLRNNLSPTLDFMLRPLVTKD
jgi:hypothetical protein